SRLDHDDRWRLNIHVGAKAFTDFIGYSTEEIDESGTDYRITDSFLPHPCTARTDGCASSTPRSQTQSVVGSSPHRPSGRPAPSRAPASVAPVTANNVSALYI